jgi:uncharacterized protein YjhX (UPF0386 family)
MVKTIRISLDGQSKGVVASVQIECDTLDGKEILKETIDLFEEVDKYATLKSIQKMR